MNSFPQINSVLYSIGLCLMLFVIAVGILLWGQLRGANPLRFWQRREYAATPAMFTQWETPFEVGLVLFMVVIPLMIVRGLLVIFTNQDWLVDGLMVLMGIILFVLSLDNLETCCQYLGSEMWRTTWGKAYSVNEGELPPYTIAPELPKKSLVYVYEVNGKQYYNTRIDAHNYRGGSMVRRPVASTHFNEVLVYYHPDDPNLSVLVPGVNWSSVSVVMGMAIAFVLIPIIFMILSP